jgi:hypothetical protein
VTLSKPLDVLPAVETGDASAACGPSIPDGSVTMQGGGLTGVVVWLDGARSGKAPPIERRVELESDHCRLIPRVQAALKGSAVNIIGMMTSASICASSPPATPHRARSSSSAAASR